jgi:hypothetical protein
LSSCCGRDNNGVAIRIELQQARHDLLQNPSYTLVIDARVTGVEQDAERLIPSKANAGRLRAIYLSLTR